MNRSRIRYIEELASMDADQRASIARATGCRIGELDALTAAKHRGELPLITRLTDDQFKADYPDIADLLRSDDLLQEHLGHGEQ